MPRFFWVTLLWSLLSIGGCSGTGLDVDDGPLAAEDASPSAMTGERPSEDPRWRWSSPQPSGIDLHAVWGAASDDVWSVGAAGTILHFDGRDWAPVESGTSLPLNAVWGTSSNDVWAVGGEHSFVDPRSPAVGVILHWDGQAFSEAAAPSEGLFGVWGSAPDDAWAVGYGVILHWDGREWSSVSVDRYNLLDVWGSSATDVWAVGDYPPVLHWDGSTWTPVMSDELGAIGACGGASGTAADDVWSVSPNRGLQHWNGAEWTRSDAPFGPGCDVWAGSDVVWAVSAQGAILRLRDGAWSLVESGVRSALRGIWGASESDVWAVGAAGVLLHWDGIAWTPWSNVTPEHQLYDVWASGDGSAWAVGFFWEQKSNGELVERGAIARWIDGDWRVQARPPAPLHGVWGASADDVWAVGHEGVALHWDGRDWTETRPSTYRVESVWGTAADDVWAAGYAGIAHFDGERWETRDATPYLEDVWGLARDDVWVVGDYGTTLHWDGNTWTTHTVASDERLALSAVWGSESDDVWAVGYVVTGTPAVAGVIAHWDGEVWSYDRTSTPLHDVVGYTSDDVWAVGDGGVIVHWDGRAWSVASDVPAGAGALYGVGGASPNEIWAVGARATVLLRSP